MTSAPQYICNDADAHLTEARDTWTSRVPAKFKDHAPAIRWVEAEKLERWFVGDVPMAAVGITACAGYEKSFPDFPPTFDEAIVSAYDAKARLEYMDSVGIWAQVIYPNVGGFGAQEFMQLKDEELRLACVRAYNDFLVDWTSVDPRRFVINVALPMWDVEACVKEISRCAKRGFRGINFTAAPQEFGLPFLADPYWEPLWSIAEETGFPISFHVGNGDIGMGKGAARRMELEGTAALVARLTIEGSMNNGRQLADVLFSGILPRHPKLKFVSVESGIGWIPFLLESADYQFNIMGVRRARPEFKMLPSEYFRQHVYACYWFEKNPPEHVLDAVGRNNILFETDFPHPTCIYADNVAETIATGTGRLAPEVRQRILMSNAAELFKIEKPPAVSASLQ